MSLNINRSSIDSERFGVVVARAWFPSSEQDVVRLLDFCQQEKIALCIVRVDNDFSQVVAELHQHHFFTADRIVTLRLDISHAGPSLDAPKMTVRPACANDEEFLVEIARLAFRDYPGHYFNDPRLDRKAVAEVFPDWIGRALKRSEKDSTVLVAERENIPAGFVALLREPPRVVIDLVAVLPDFQHQGCLQAMLLASAAWAHAQGANTLSIATQVDNTAVQKACAGLGFTQGPLYQTLHGWF